MGFLKKLFGGQNNKPNSVSQPVSNPVPAPPPAPEPVQINEISPADLKARLDNGDDLIVVDMRQGWEYQSGHIPGAMHMFLQEIPARFNELPQNKDVIFQCWHGNTSLQASGFLIQNGWNANRVFSLNGGMAGWASTFGQAGLTKD